MNNNSTISKYEKNVEQFLNNKRVATGSPFTHVAMGETFVGKFYLNEEDIQQFNKLYTKALKKDCVFSIAEKPKEYGPILVDIDLEKTVTDNNERLYNDDMILNVIDAYKQVITKYIKLEDHEYNVSVFEKPKPTIKKDNIIKDGFHLIFHNLVIHYKLRYLLRDQVVKILEKLNIFNGYSVDKIVDKAVINTNCWLLSGSKKKDGQLYELTKIYNKNNMKCNIDNILSNKEELITKYSLLDSENNENYQSEFNDGFTLEIIENEFLKMNSKDVKVKSKVNDKVNNDINIKHVEICLKCIDNYDNYQTWLDVAMISNNILNDDEIEIFLEWASQSNKYNRDENIKKLSELKKDGELKMGSLIHMAEESNLELYNELMKELKPQKAEKAEIDIYNLNTTEIANHFKLKFSHKFICQFEKVYCYNGIYWKMEKEDKSASLNNFLGDEYFDYLYKFVSTEETNKLKDKKNDTTEIIEKFNKIRSYLNNLKNYDKRQKFIKDIQLKLKNEDIIFDDNPDLFAFENKIYDLQNHEFIKPKAEQYISITTGYKWENKDESLNKIEVDKIINTILSDAEIKKLYLTILSTGLDGRLTEKFTIANGSGGNGKGVINEFVYEMLGNYAYIIPSSILLDKIKSGANVEVSELHRKRLVITREPDAKSSINGATIKEITGGSDINSRGLYSSNTKTKLNLSLIMECNDKPKLDEANDAMARRILDIPFKNRFVDKNIYDELDEDEKTNTFLINSEYKTKEFKEKYRQALFLILCDYHKEYIKNNRSLPICKEILQRNKDYLQSSDEYYCWFKDNYEKTNNKKDIIKLKDIYDNFSHSNFFINLTKNEKRNLNYKAFVDRMQKNMFLKKYIGTNNHNVYIITNYKALINDDDDEDDNDKNILDL